MAEEFYHFLIHHRLLDALRQADDGVRQRVQKTLERLQLGEWKNGTRVKLLRGVRQPVFEARVDKARRMLFTIRRLPAMEPPHEPTSFALIWDVVEHDAVTRKARRLNHEPEAGFLHFAVADESDLTTPPNNADVSIGPDDDLSSVRRKLSEVTQSPAMEMIEPIRWFSLHPDEIIEEDAWQELMDAGRANELELKLTREQAGVIDLPGPVLLRGAAGSGKTTVSVYRAAAIAENWPEARILYVTYNAGLLETAERQFADLCAVRRCDRHAQPDFLTFPALCHRLTADRFQQAQHVRWPRFRAWYEAVFGADNTSLAWEEFRGIIKGACLEPTDDHLSFDAYEKLGRKRAPLFRSERQNLYRRFDRYRQWCDRASRIDDVDLARAAYRESNETWDFVVCDEGQDLTELEVALLLRLCERPDGLFFAADPQQTINPSGFRWAELRTLLRDRLPGRSAPEVTALSRNFRSVATIVNVANAIVGIQRDRTGRTDDDHLQESSLHGPAPLVVGGSATTTLDQLRGFGPRCAVIVADGQTGDALSAQLDSERVFPIAEAKGLEFDGCVLWNLISADVPLWEELLTGNAQLRQDPAARLALRHLYVGVTRSRRHLGIYEEDERAVELWRSGPFQSLIEQDQPEAFAKFMLSAGSPEQWIEEGDWFLARGRFRQAAECFRRAGRGDRETGAMAAWRRSAGEFAEAADLFESAGNWGEAAECFLKIGQHERAAERFQRAERPRDAAACWQELKRWGLAAKHWRIAGDEDNYRRCRLRERVANRDWNQAAELAEKLEMLDEAISYYRRAGNRQRARELTVELAQQSGDHSAAATALERQKKWMAAAESWDAAGDQLRANRCRAQAAETENRLRDAAHWWKRAEEFGNANTCLAKAAEADGDYLKAAKIWANSGKTSERDRALAQAEDGPAVAWAKALSAEKEHRFLDAVTCYEAAGFDNEAIRIGDFIENMHPNRAKKRYGLSEWDLRSLERDIVCSEPFLRAEIRLSKPATKERKHRIRDLSSNPRENASFDLLLKLATNDDDRLLQAVYLHKLDRKDEAENILAQVPGCKRKLADRARTAAEDNEQLLLAAQFAEMAGQTRRPHELRAEWHEYQCEYEEAAAQWELAGFHKKAEHSRKGLRQDEIGL